MNRNDIIRMAREAGLLRSGDGWTEPHRWGITEIERFAALIEQHLYYDGIHTCHDECQRPSCVAIREEVKAEREACAQLCESYGPARVLSGEDCAAAIRTKGQKLEQKANVHDKVYSEVELANAYQKGWDDAMLRRSIRARGEK